MLALICGTGSLPLAVAQAQDEPPLVCVLDGFAPTGLDADIVFRLESLGSFLRDLQDRGVRDICLCGAISRPVVDPALIDAATQPLVPALLAAMAQGDDGALRGVIEILQTHGFALCSAADLAPTILPPAGVLTRAQPGQQARADVQEALMALADMGRVDLGQACVVAQGIVIAREDMRGTDAMLTDLAKGQGSPTEPDLFGQVLNMSADVLDDVADWLSGIAERPKAGLLFKAPKPGQDRRADLPTIGPKTALGAVRAGLAGIVIEAGGVIVLDRQAVIKILDEAGLFLWVRAP